MMTISSNASRLYVLWSLFLSGYAPLAIIFAMRLVAKSRPLKAEAGAAIAVLLALNLILALRVFRSSPEEFTATSVESRGGDLAAYVATYLLPFAMAGDVTNWDLGAYAAFLFMVGVVCVRNELVHLNPLLALFGYRVYTITTGRNRQWIAISFGTIRPGDNLEARTIANRLLFVTKNVSASERSELD